MTLKRDTMELELEEILGALDNGTNTDKEKPPVTEEAAVTKEIEETIPEENEEESMADMEAALGNILETLTDDGEAEEEPVQEMPEEPEQEMPVQKEPIQELPEEPTEAGEMDFDFIERSLESVIETEPEQETDSEEEELSEVSPIEPHPEVDFSSALEGFLEDKVIISKEEQERYETEISSELTDFPEERKTAEKKNRKEKKEVRKKKNRTPVKVLATVFFSILMVLVVFAAAVVIIYSKGKSSMISKENMDLVFPTELAAESQNKGKLLTYEGKNYRMRSEASNILFIGKKSYPFSMVLVNFDEGTHEMSSLPIPMDLLEIDMYSAMRYSDLVNAVSDLLYGIPIQGYVIAELPGEDGSAPAAGIENNFRNQENVRRFLAQMAIDSGNDWMTPWNVFSSMGDNLFTDMSIPELCYVYVTLINCWDQDGEMTELKDETMLFQEFLDTFYEAE